MRRYVEVYWTPWIHNDIGRNSLAHVANLIVQPPQPIISEIAKNRIGKPMYLRCPAFVGSCHNAFLIKSPVDINIKINDDNSVTTDRYGQEFYDLYIGNREHQTAKENPFLMHTFPSILFFAKESVEMEMMDPILVNSGLSRNVRIVPGVFNIYKWVRPIDFTFEVIDRTAPLVFKVDDPLFMVRFKTKNNLPVKFVRVPFNLELKNFVNSFVLTKKIRPFLPLKDLYDLAKNYVDFWWRKK